MSLDNFIYLKCTRFPQGPNHSHEVAIHHLTQYLKGTKNNGCILKLYLIVNLQLNLYTDADFAGFLASEDKLDPVSVNSRTGILFTPGNVSINWSSKL